MTSPITIWRENRTTFGGGGRAWSAGEVTSYNIGLLFISFIIALIVDRPSDNYFNAVLTAVSIIAGFTFNALIFLVDGRFSVITDATVLEQRSRQDKIDRLSKSSFLVIYYFNVVSVLVVASCIIALLGPSVGARLPKSVHGVLQIIEIGGRGIFFALLIESGVTFYRALRRLRYLFGKVRNAGE